MPELEDASRIKATQRSETGVRLRTSVVLLVVGAVGWVAALHGAGLLKSPGRERIIVERIATDCGIAQSDAAIRQICIHETTALQAQWALPRSQLDSLYNPRR